MSAHFLNPCKTSTKKCAPVSSNILFILRVVIFLDENYNFSKEIKQEIKDMERNPQAFVSREMCLANRSFFSSDVYDVLQESGFNNYYKNLKNDNTKNYITPKDIVALEYKDLPENYLDETFDIIIAKTKNIHFSTNNIVLFLTSLLEKRKLSEKQIGVFLKQIDNVTIEKVYKALSELQNFYDYTNETISQNIKNICNYQINNIKHNSHIHGYFPLWCCNDTVFVKSVAQNGHLSETQITEIINNTPFGNLKDFLFSKCDCNYKILNFPATDNIDLDVYKTAVSVFDYGNATKNQISNAVYVITNIIKANRPYVSTIVVDLISRCNDIYSRGLSTSSIGKTLMCASNVSSQFFVEIFKKTYDKKLLNNIINELKCKPCDEQIQIAVRMLYECNRSVDYNRINCSKFVENTIKSGVCSDELYNKLLKGEYPKLNHKLLLFMAASEYTPEKFNEILEKRNGLLNVVIKLKKAFNGTNMCGDLFYDFVSQIEKNHKNGVAQTYPYTHDDCNAKEVLSALECAKKEIKETDGFDIADFLSSFKSFLDTGLGLQTIINDIVKPIDDFFFDSSLNRKKYCNADFCDEKFKNAVLQTIKNLSENPFNNHPQLFRYLYKFVKESISNIVPFGATYLQKISMESSVYKNSSLIYELLSEIAEQEYVSKSHEIHDLTYYQEEFDRW